MFENMLTVKGICEKYSVGRYTVDKARQEGKLTAYRPNNREYRFRESDVEKWLQGTRVETKIVRFGVA